MERWRSRTWRQVQSPLPGLQSHCPLSLKNGFSRRHISVAFGQGRAGVGKVGTEDKVREKVDFFGRGHVVGKRFSAKKRKQKMQKGENYELALIAQVRRRRYLLSFPQKNAPQSKLKQTAPFSTVFTSTFTKALTKVVELEIQPPAGLCPNSL